MVLYGGVEFVGNPDELVLVTPQTVYESIPDDLPVWKTRYQNIVGHSAEAKFMTKGQIFGYALNAYAQHNLPQFFYSTSTFYAASHWFLTASDLREKDGTLDDDILAFWAVTATGHHYEGTTDEADPCLDKFHNGVDTSSYFGYPPVVRRAIPYPAPCKQNKEHFEIFERNTREGTSRWQWVGRDPDGVGTTIWCSGGGIQVDVTQMEVTEGGLIFVSLPDLPYGAPEPPPLIGYVTDTGPPGERGLQGVPGPPGADGVSPSGDSMVDTICSLSSEKKDELKNCLEPFGEIPNLYAVVLASSETEIRAAQTVLVETTPELVIPQTVVVAIDTPEPYMTAERIVGTLGWRLTLVLPIALLAIKMLTESIQVFECDQDGRFGHKVLSTPMLSLSGVSQKAIWQTLFNQIGWLLRCCPPCDLDTWKFLKTHTGDFHIYDLEPFTAIRLVLQDETMPEINSWYHELNIHKLGEVRFVYEDHIQFHTEGYIPRHTTLKFWNSREQVFRHEGSDIFGFTINMEYPKEYDIYVQYLLPDVII